METKKGLRYLNCTHEKGLNYSLDTGIDLAGYIDYIFAVSHVNWGYATDFLLQLAAGGIS